jgi:hypothetical protein
MVPFVRCRPSTRRLQRVEGDVMEKKPDFSGDWVLDRQASTLSPGADGVQSAIWHIEHREPAFRHKAAFTTASTPIEYEYELQSDGREVVGIEHGVRSVSSLRWEGQALVVRFETQLPDAATVISFQYELLDAGRRLRATEQVRGTDHDQDNIWMFERR